MSKSLRFEITATGAEDLKEIDVEEAVAELAGSEVHAGFNLNDLIKYLGEEGIGGSVTLWGGEQDPDDGGFIDPVGYCFTLNRID